ncbi:MAG: hypothetical protein KDE27_08095 [Planctomycetes bacterium]|nr:hypothetical protein [Planctomycetota bacterium]
MRSESRKWIAPISIAALAACAGPLRPVEVREWSSLLDAPTAAAPAVATPQGSAVVRPENRRDPASRLEFTLQGAGTSDERLRAGGAQLASSVGYYATEQLLLAVRQNVSANKAGDSSASLWDGATRFAVDYLFPQANVVPQVAPYVGISIGYLYGDSIAETMAAGPELGVKYYIKPDVFLQLGAEYDFTFRSSDRIDKAFENGSFFYGLGFGACF